MSHYLPVINAFIEDTCVLVVIAYLMARGRMLALLFPERRDQQTLWYPGLALGLAGVTEIVFPGARSPYVVHTLIVTFATLAGGLPVGMVAALTVTCGVYALHAAPDAFTTALPLFLAVLFAAGTRRLFGNGNTLLRALLTGMLVQAGVLLLRSWAIPSETAATARAFLSVPANGFGAALLQLILNDAQARARSERHRIEVERAQTLIAEAQLTALRARVHPHFLFNALTSIAALCSIAPDKAEIAIVRLSQLMRRALEANPAAPLPLRDEINHVRGYLEIEQHRLGNRLAVFWELDPNGMDAPVPAFALQTLVENAILHGISPKMEPAAIRIIVRARGQRTLIAVADTGAGMDADTRREARYPIAADREHGLQIVTKQLTLLYGPSARLRLFSRPDVGAIAAFKIPGAGGS